MLRRALPLLAAGALVAGALVAPTAAAGRDAAVVVSGEGSPAASGSSRSGGTAIDTRAEDPEVTFLVGLPRDRDALDAAAVERSTPGNLLYRDHPTISSAGKTYGASSKKITKLRAAAAGVPTLPAPTPTAPTAAPAPVPGPTADGGATAPV
jgi:hypothetical protein